MTFDLNEDSLRFTLDIDKRTVTMIVRWFVGKLQLKVDAPKRMPNSIEFRFINNIPEARAYEALDLAEELADAHDLNFGRVQP